MTSTEPLLSIRDLEVRYGPALALDGVSVDVKQGDVLAVLGSNGAGKSTLARTISGLVPAVKGEVLFEGKNIASGAAYRTRRAGVIYLPEGRGIFPALTVTENLRIAACMLGRGQRRGAMDNALSVFPPLAARRRTKAGMLSGGEQQMLSLARALVMSPKMIIADEMSLGLAPKLVDTVFEALAGLKETGVTIILIEQFIHRALEFSDHCLMLSRGRAAWQGPAADAKQEVLTRFLGEAAAVPV
ncbi:ABC transporter ATP-binding protein [Jatrophihabitans sp. DSM 45814]